MAVSERIWEIDFLRGLAIILMVIFHLAVDLTDFYGYRLNYMSGWWYYEGKLAAVMFAFLAGVSTRFSRHCLRHGLILLGWGMVITLVTYFYAPYAYVRFGILHLIGSGLILSYYLRRISGGGGMLFFALLLLCGGMVTEQAEIGRQWLVPFGIAPAGFMSLDYYPLLPWGGVVLLGTWAGNRIYKAPGSILKRAPEPNFLTYIGRHSLRIYLLHQPVLLALLWLVFRS